MMRPVLSLCFVSVLVLGACATNSGPASFEAKPSYSGPYSRPLSDVQPASKEEDKARVHTDLGWEYFNIGRPDIALDEARIALKAKSGYPSAYHLMGLAYMTLDQNAEADDAFRRALDAAPGDPEFNNSYGLFLCRQKRVSEAMSRFATSVANPYYCCKARPYTNAGRCMLDNNEFARAEAQFSRALEADPKNSDEALYGLAESGYRRGDDRHAHDLLSKYHQRFTPTARSVWLGLRVARRMGERHAEASYAEQLRSRFMGSEEYGKMMRGNYE
jgi:type IV pilus assembly protein PilF